MGLARLGLVILLCPLGGCPLPNERLDSGPVGVDSAIDRGTPGSDVPTDLGAVDSGYDPVLGNSFEGPVIFDDERVGNVDPRGLRAGSSPCREPVLARVTRVVDGDTVRITAVSEALSTTVRLIGVDTPEVGRDGRRDECYAPESVAFTEQLTGRLVWLTFDGTCLDPFDRLLAYLHVGGGPQDLWERQLLRRGLGRLLIIGNNDSLRSTLTSDQADAQGASRGLFGACE